MSAGELVASTGPDNEGAECFKKRDTGQHQARAMHAAGVFGDFVTFDLIASGAAYTDTFRGSVMDWKTVWRRSVRATLVVAGPGASRLAACYAHPLLARRAAGVFMLLNGTRAIRSCRGGQG